MAEAAQSVETTAPVTAPSSEGPGFEMASLLADDDLDTTPTPEPAAAETKPVETKPVETAPVVEKPVEAPVEQVVVVKEKPVETKPVETKPAAAPTETKPVETKPVEQPAVDIKAQRDKTLTMLEQSFQLTPEQAEAIRTEPEKIVPKLQAIASLRTFEAVTTSIMNQLPGIIMEIQQRMAASRDVEQKFISRWPQLKDPKYIDEIVRTARLLEQLRPDSTVEQRIEEVGMAIASHHKLLVPPTEAPVKAVPKVVTTPVSPTRPGTVIKETVAESPYKDLLDME